MFHSFFLLTINQELFHYLQVEIFIPVDISKVYVMSSPISQSSPAFHSFFNKKNTSTETATKLDFISSLWDDDHVWRRDIKNWQCLWCNQCFQGISATKALANVLGKKGIHIKSCCVAKEKLTQQDTKNISNTNRLRRVFFLIIQNILKHLSQVYRISHLLLSNPPSIVVPKVSLHIMKLIHL